MRGIVEESASTHWLLATVLVALMVLAAGVASAAVTTSPPTSTVVAGQVSPAINLTLTFPPDPLGGITGIVVFFAGLPAGVSTIPSPIILSAAPGVGTLSTTFSVSTSLTTPPGTYPISITTSPDIGAGTGAFVLIVPTPSFEATISPNPLSLPWGGAATVMVSTTPISGFSSDISYAFSGFPSGITTGGSRVVSPPYAPADFAFNVAPRTPPGAYPGSLVATWGVLGPQSRTLPMTVIVQPPTLTAAFSPPALTVAAGGPAGNGALVLTPGNGYTGAPALTWGPIPTGIEITPLVFASPSLPPSQSIPVTVRANGAAPGTYPITARAADNVATVDSTATLVVTIAPPPDASIAVSPPAIGVTAGQSATVLVTATGINGFTGTLQVTSPAVPSVTFTPPSFSLGAGESKQVVIRAAIAATPGTSVATFSASSTTLTGTRTATLNLTVTPPSPEITSATPPALTAGSSGVRVVLSGLHFRPGAIVTFTPPGPIVKSSVVTSSTLVNIVVDTPVATVVGRYRVDLRNPDGASTATGIPVLVCPPSSLGAPLSVPTAAIVYPRPYAAVTLAELVYPRAVLATTGVGTIIGTWRFDGTPFDQFVVAASGGYPVEVTSKMPLPVATSGEHRLELVVEQPQQLATEPVPVIVSIESKSGLRILEPRDGEAVSRSSTTFRWTIVPGASGYVVELSRPDDPRTRTIRLSDSRWNPDARTLESLGPGSHRFRVAAVFPGEVRGRPTDWLDFVVPEVHAAAAHPAGERTVPRRHSGTVRLVSLQSTEELVGAPATSEVELPRDWAVTLLGTGNETDEDVPSIPDAARLQLTTAGDLQDTAYFTKWTGDLSERKDLEPEYGSEAESRAWQVELGAQQSRSREELRAGYSPPEFLDQSEFIAAGLARGGILGKVATPLGSVSFYDTFHDDAAGAVSAYDLEQRITGAAWEAPGDTNRSLLRVFGLRTQGRGSFESPETEAEAVGVLWRFVSSPALTVIVEGAHGTLDGVLQANGEEFDGYGLRLGANGTKGTFSWGVNFRDVDADLVNPANLGLSVGAVPDRVGGDLTLGKYFGSMMLSLQVRSQESGTLADGSGEKVDEKSGTLTFIAPLGTGIMASANASATTTEGEGDPIHGLPGSDRTMYSLGVTVSETFGSLSVAESITWQDLSDAITSAFDSTVTSGSVTAGGMLGTSVMLSVLLSGTRSESPEPVGTTDLWLAALQPTFNWTKAAIAFTPRASYSRVESELGGTSDSEQYGLVVQWSPAWWQSFVNVQLGADWNRTSSEGLPTPSFDQRIVASLTLRWGLSRATLAATPAAPLPSVPSATASLAARSRGDAVLR